jgi:major vault protein
VKVLGEEEALLLKAREDCEDKIGKHKAGEKWMIQGPMDYIPMLEVEVLETRRSIPLNSNEGIYIRDLDSG